MITIKKNIPACASLIPCALLLTSLPAVLPAQKVGLIEHVAANSVEVNIITPGPDGALWFTDGPSIGRMTTAGAFSQYPIPSLNPTNGITTGPDGALWFTEEAGSIGRITTAGVVTEFPLPVNQSGTFIAAGPDGALWFTEFGAHFMAIAARVMRQILMDYARRRNTQKRSAALRVPLDEALVASVERGAALIQLDDALSDLEKRDERKAKLIEMRFFGGLTLEESAEVLDVSVSAVRSELRLAQAWLERELGRRAHSASA